MSNTNEQIAGHAAAILSLAGIDPQTRLVDITEIDSAGPILSQEPKPVALTHYRSDGFSEETTENGGRSHRLVDQVLQDLAANGLHNIVEESDRFFVFRAEDAPDLLAETPEKRERARFAVDRTMSVWERAGQPTFNFQPFKRRLANPDPVANRYFELIDGHAVVFLGQDYKFGKGWTQVTAVEAMENYASKLRRWLD